MGRAKRTELSATARRMNLEQLSRLRGELKVSRKRRRLRQVEVATRAGLTQGSVSRAERGQGGNFSLDSWQLICLAVGRRLEFRLPADALQEPADAGHLAIQELVLRLGRVAGFGRRFELPTRPADPARSADVGLRDDRRRLLVLVECWNTIGDVGAAARSSERKRAEAEQLAVAIGPLRADATVEPYRVRGCWVVRATARNRALVARYPEVFAARFPGSSAGWIRALVARVEPPAEPGLLWCDVARRGCSLGVGEHEGVGAGHEEGPAQNCVAPADQSYGPATRLFVWRRRNEKALAGAGEGLPERTKRAPRRRSDRSCDQRHRCRWWPACRSSW